MKLITIMENALNYTCKYPPGSVAEAFELMREKLDKIQEMLTKAFVDEKFREWVVKYEKDSRTE